MRGDKRQAWDSEDPEFLSRSRSALLDSDLPSARVEFLPGVRAELIRRKTYELFEGGLYSVKEQPVLRGDMFGERTPRLVEQYLEARKQLRVVAG